jgi:hypothetical protein
MVIRCDPLHLLTLPKARIRAASRFEARWGVNIPALRELSSIDANFLYHVAGAMPGRRDCYMANSSVLRSARPVFSVRPAFVFF